MGERHSFRVTQCCSVASFVWLWCCCCLFWCINIVLLSHVRPQYFLEVFYEHFPLNAEVTFMLTVTRTITIIAREVWCYLTISGDMRGTAEQRNGVRFVGSSVLLLWWIVLYCVDMWNVHKESSWKQGNIFITRKLRGIQTYFLTLLKLVSKILCHVLIVMLQLQILQIWRQEYQTLLLQ